MGEFVKHVMDLIVGHVAASIVIGIVGTIIAFAWKPVALYMRARSWLNRAVKSGVRNFFSNRESYSRDRKLAFADYLRSAEHGLTYFGHWLAFTIDQLNTLDVLCAMANSGKKIQLVLLSPDLPRLILANYARYLGEDEDQLSEEIKTTWRKVKEARATLSATGRDCLELRQHSEFIPYSAFWFDREHSKQHILIDMKLYGASRKDAYGLELVPMGEGRSPSLYERYARSLKQLEARSQRS